MIARATLPLLNESIAACPDAGICADAPAWMRPPDKTDAAGIHRLVAECPPLDLNSLYTYLLLSEHFRDTCVLAGSGDALEGFVSGYVLPQCPDVLFVWQVAVHESARGKGLGSRMLQNLLRRPGLAPVQYIETTVSPGNPASRGMFAGLAHGLKSRIQETPLFERSLFGSTSHDDEPLLRIGPFQRV